MARLLSRQKACQYLGVSPSSLYTIMRREEIPYIRIGVGKLSHYRFDLDHLDEWIESRCFIGTGAAARPTPRNRQPQEETTS